MLQSNTNQRIQLIAKVGVMTALIALATAFIHVPTGMGGYVNGGDAVILASVAILGYWSIPAAGIGSALVDVMMSYAHYAPGTLIIKSLMALYCAFMLRNSENNRSGMRLLTFVLTELIMVAGYFFYEWLLFGLGKAMPAVLPNLIQAAFGVIAGSLLYPILKRINQRSSLSR